MKKAEIPRIKLKNTDKQPIFKRFKAEHFEKSAVFVFCVTIGKRHFRAYCEWNWSQLFSAAVIFKSL